MKPPLLQPFHLFWFRVSSLYLGAFSFPFSPEKDSTLIVWLEIKVGRLPCWWESFTHCKCAYFNCYFSPFRKNFHLGENFRILAFRKISHFDSFISVTRKGKALFLEFRSRVQRFIIYSSVWIMLVHINFCLLCNSDFVWEFSNSYY